MSASGPTIARHGRRVNRAPSTASGGPAAHRTHSLVRERNTSAGTSYAAVSDWAMTGATPANWDPNSGIYAPQLKKLKNQKKN